MLFTWIGEENFKLGMNRSAMYFLEKNWIFFYSYDYNLVFRIISCSGLNPDPGRSKGYKEKNGRIYRPVLSLEASPWDSTKNNFFRGSSRNINRSSIQNIFAIIKCSHILLKKHGFLSCVKQCLDPDPDFWIWPETVVMVPLTWENSKRN